MKVKASTIKEMNNPYFQKKTFQATASAKKQRIHFIFTTIGKNQVLKMFVKVCILLTNSFLFPISQKDICKINRNN